MDNFDFNIDNKNLSVVTLVSGGLSFGLSCIAVLGFPEYISIGIDRENKRIAVKATSPDDSTKNCYRFVTEENKESRIKDNRIIVKSNKIYTEILRLISDKPVRRGTKFLAFFDDAAEMLIVDLKNRVV